MSVTACLLFYNRDGDNLIFTCFYYRDRVDLLVSVKPWVKIDGTLNRRVLDRLLGAVLSHVLLKPGCSVYQVAERFHPALQPFQTRELIEVVRIPFPFLSFYACSRLVFHSWQILENMGCLDLYGILKRSKPGPFSKREPVEIGINLQLIYSLFY